MLGFDALGRLALGQLPSQTTTALVGGAFDLAPAKRRGADLQTSGVLVALAVSTYAPQVEPALRYKTRTFDNLFYQQVGLPITPAPLTPVYVEQAQKFKMRINDPPPYLQVGLPITPAALTPVFVDQPMRRLRQEESRQAVFVPPYVPVVYSFVSHEFKRRADLDRVGFIAPALGTPTPATLAADYIEQAQRYVRRINDPQPQIVVVLPITPAPLTADPVDQGLKFKYRINDPQPYLQVGLPITPAALSPVAFDYSHRRYRQETWQSMPVALPPLVVIYNLAVPEYRKAKDSITQATVIPSIGTQTPSALAPVYVEQGQKFKYRINDPQPYLQVGLPITPTSLTPIIIEPHQQRRRDFDSQPFSIVPVTYTFGWGGFYSDVRPARRDYRDITISLAQQFTQTPVALSPVLVDLLYRKIGLPEWVGNVNQPMPTPTPSTLAPVYVEQGLKFKYRINEPQPYLQVGLPITPAALSPVFVDHPLRRQRAPDLGGLPIILPAPVQAPFALAEITPPRRNVDVQAVSIRPIFSTFFIRSLDELGQRRRAQDIAALPFKPAPAVATPSTMVDWSDYANGRRRMDAMALGNVLRPTTQVVRLLLTRTLTGAGV